jgi:hypothetical protein
MTPGKLLVETTGYDDLEYLTEGTGDISTKKYFIKGPYLEANSRNRNGRIYESRILFPEVERFVTEKVKTRRALGSADHPKDSTLLIKDAAILTTELNIDGNMVYGKSEVLDTDCGGRTLKVLMDANVQLAVSSRGLGQLSREGVVGDNFKLISIDAVVDPSAPKSFVENIYESQDYIIQNDKLVAVNMEELNRNYHQRLLRGKVARDLAN